MRGLIMSVVVFAASGLALASDPLAPDKGDPLAGMPTSQPATAGGKPMSAEEKKILEQIQNDELTRSLLNGDQKKDEMGKAMDFMDISRLRLAQKFDPGKATQWVQEQVLTNIDQVIEQVKKQQQGGSSKDKQQQKGDKKERGSGPPQPGQGQPNGQQPGKPQPNKGTTAAQQSVMSAGQSEAADANRDIREDRREWGSLPPRDREEVVQGVADQKLEKYREQIERYYMMLNQDD